MEIVMQLDNDNEYILRLDLSGDTIIGSESHALMFKFLRAKTPLLGRFNILKQNGYKWKRK